MKTCCNDVEVCLGYDYQFVDELTYKLKDRLQQLAFKKLQNLKYKYFCEEDLDSQINKINIFINSLTRIKTSYLHIQKYCLPSDRIRAIIEKALKIAGKAPCPTNRRDIKIDDSQINSYLLQSPRCVSYNTWNKFASYLCGKLGLKVTAEKQACDLSFEITRKSISCNLLYSLQVRKNLCDLGYSIKKTNNECKLEYKLLLENSPNCDLEFKTFVKFVNTHQLGYPILKEIYDSNLSLLEVDGEAVLCSPINNYKLTEITPSSLEELLNAGFVVSLNKNDIAIDYKK